MRKLLTLLLIIISVINSAIGQRLDGSYRIVAGQYGPDTLSASDLVKQHIVKVFKDGYWIAAFFGDPSRPFNGTGGGVYQIADGKYHETLNFYSWDSTAVGDTYTFSYKLAGNKYFQDGKMNSDKYQDFVITEEYDRIQADQPLQNASLEGAWKLVSANWTQNPEGLPGDMEEMKIYAYPRFAWALYEVATKKFIGAGGGTYRFDGKKLVEHIEYITYPIALGTDYSIDVKKLTGGKIQQLATDGNNETWVKLNSSK